jgi:hypothetical protein
MTKLNGSEVKHFDECNETSKATQDLIAQNSKTSLEESRAAEPNVDVLEDAKEVQTIVVDQVPLLLERIKIDARDKLCDCGFPLPNSALSLTQDQIRLRDILLQKRQECDKSVISLGFEAALWELYMNLVLEQGDYSSFIDIVLMLNNLSLLQRDDFEKLISDNPDICSKLLDRFAQLGSEREPLNMINCLKCDKQLTTEAKLISLEEVANFIIRTSGAVECIHLLKMKADILPLSNLSMDFYLSIVRRQVVAKYQSSLTWNKLTQLNQQLCRTESKTNFASGSRKES